MHKIVSLLRPNKNLNELNSLYQKPKKDIDTEMPTFQVFKSGLIEQADLLFLPTDRFGFKYCLVVVDDHSKKCDAVPLKNKSADAINKGLKLIYSRGIVPKPKILLEVDAGKEFLGVKEALFKNENTRVRPALTNRHRSQGLVEYKNKIIGAVIHQLQAIKEMETKKTSKTWVSELPEIIKLINEHSLPKPVTTQKSDEPYSTKSNMDLLPIGTRVRTILDYPEDVANGKRLHGDFRESDIRWSRKIYEVKDIILKPSFPPMYLVGDDINNARTRNQLQVVKDNFV